MKGSGTYKDNLGVLSVKLISQTTAAFTSPSARILGGAQFAKSFSNFPVPEGCLSVFPPLGSNVADNDVPISAVPSSCFAPPYGQANCPKCGTDFGSIPSAYLISPEDAEYNVLAWFFTGTTAAASFGSTEGTAPAPLNYLQVYDADIQYAEKGIEGWTLENGWVVFNVTAQSLLHLASQKLSSIAD